MKKVISVFLAAIMAFSVLVISAGAAGGEFQTYYMAYDIKDSKISIVPVEGYSQYVLPGEDFKFYIETAEGYSDTFVIVEVDAAAVEPDVHGVYTISDIGADKTITAYLSVKNDQSNLFSSLIVFVHNILAWFQNIIETIKKGIAT